MSEIPAAPRDTADPLEAAIQRALEQSTLCAAFQVTAAANADRPALLTLGDDAALTWRDYADRVRRVATGLTALGVEPGDAVGIMLANRTEFHIVDSATLHLGGIAFSIYNTNPPEQIAPLIENSGARVVVTEPAFAEKLTAVADRLEQLEHVVVVDAERGPGDLTLGELEELPAPAYDFEAAWRAVTPETIGGIVYTSGTTGAPKGVEWSHGALLHNVRSMGSLAPPSPEGRVVSYLPMAHLAERFISHYCSMAFGYTIASVPDPRQLAAGLAQARPTRFFGVPRIFEKLAPAVQQVAGAAELGETLQSEVERVRAEGAGTIAERSPGAVALEPVRARLGLDAAEWVGSASAPARVDVLEVFAAIGLPIAEIWGMSETALSLVNPSELIKIGTVGKPQPGVEAMLAEDGELLVRGPIFSGYRNDPERTREAVDGDGWMHTGDIATVDDDGYYRIVDRKKEIIINSAGRNIAPQKVENAVKQQSPLVGHVVAIGDARLYLTALVVLDEEGLGQFAAGRQLRGSPEELAGAEPVRAEVARAVESANDGLARVEQIKSYKLIPGPWLPGGDEVTMTMKLKRRVIDEKYADEIAALYA